MISGIRVRARHTRQHSQRSAEPSVSSLQRSASTIPQLTRPYDIPLDVADDLRSTQEKNILNANHMLQQVVVTAHLGIQITHHYTGNLS